MSRTFQISKTSPSSKNLNDNAARLQAVDAAEILKARGLAVVEASSIANADLVAAPSVHGLLAAVHVSFGQHLPFVLSPDAVWIAIAQALARHVDANAEAMRSGLVRHQGQIEIDVRRDEFVKGAKNDWAGAIDELSQQLEPHLGGRRDLFVADFSTTTIETRVASEVALLSGMQKFFSYSVSTLCGIPSIVLEGTPDDWASIRKRIDALSDLGLGDWARVLRPIAEKIHASSLGEIDQDFWCRIYKPMSASGGDEVVGWITALFPFLGDEGTNPNPALDKWMDGNLGYEPFRSPKLSAFPTGLSQAPFTWNYYQEKLPMSFCAGAFGVEQDARGVRPRFGWAITPRVVRRNFVAHKDFAGSPSLSPLQPKTIVTLVGLVEETAGVGPFGLNLGWCEKLESFEGVVGTELESLSAIECNRVANLDALRGLTKLCSVAIHQCSGLRDISALSTLSGLRHLTLSRCPNIEDLRVVAALRGLESLTLFHLPGLPEPLFGQYKDAESIARVQAALSK